MTFKQIFGFNCLPLLFSGYIYWTYQTFIPLILYLFFSIITLIFYIVDKQRAKNQAWRIPEITLHLLELAGGWPGALIAQYWIRHKNAKKSYQIVFWLIVFSHFLSWILLCFLI